MSSSRRLLILEGLMTAANRICKEGKSCDFCVTLIILRHYPGLWFDGTQIRPLHYPGLWFDGNPITSGIIPACGQMGLRSYPGIIPA